MSDLLRIFIFPLFAFTYALVAFGFLSSMLAAGDITGQFSTVGRISCIYQLLIRATLWII
jgi:hypothetical protein